LQLTRPCNRICIVGIKPNGSIEFGFCFIPIALVELNAAQDPASVGIVGIDFHGPSRVYQSICAAGFLWLSPDNPAK
jgi:hypothetical protein